MTLSLENSVRTGAPTDPVPLDIREVIAVTRMSKTQVYALIAVGEFPAPFHYPTPGNKPGRRSYWVAAEVFAWVASHAAKRTSRPFVNPMDRHLHDIGRPLSQSSSAT